MTSECIIWTGALDAGGYARRGKALVHREILIADKGPPPEGHEASHTCDNRACINPAHLIWETHADNNRRQRGKKRGTYRTKGGLWAAHVRESGHLIYLGSFPSEEEAHKAYRRHHESGR